MCIYLGMSHSKGSIVEQSNLSDFLDDNDYAIIFFDMLRDFAFEKNPNLKRNINMSYLLKNYLDDFVNHYGIDNDRLRYVAYNKHAEVLGRELYNKGLYDLHIHAPEEKFTEKYGKLLNYLISRLNIPPHVKIDVVEDIPNVIDFIVTAPYSEIVKSDSDTAQLYRNFFHNSYSSTQAMQKLFKEIQQFLNVQKGRPTTGGVELSSSNQLLNREEWTKQFLKDLRARIKSNPEVSEKIKAVKLSTNGLNNTIDLVLTNPSQYETWGSRRAEMRDKITNLFDFVKEQIDGMGLNNGYFSVDSPTWRKNF